MAAPIKLFEGITHANLYLQFRPSVPQTVFKTVLQHLQEKKSKPFKLAVDVGCGSGQSTRPLAPHFENVIGVDVSEAQLEVAQQANNPPNVEYRLGSAERIPVSDGSVDLVSCCQSAHWFDFKAFCNEADRVLQPCGCITIFTYGNRVLQTRDDQNESKNKNLMKLFLNFYEDSMGPYWNQRRKHIDNLMADFTVPYAGSIRDESFQLVEETTVASFIGYLSTWSSYRLFLEKNPAAADPLKGFHERLMEILDVDTTAEKTMIRLKAPGVLLLGRKPSS